MSTHGYGEAELLLLINIFIKSETLLALVTLSMEIVEY